MRDKMKQDFNRIVRVLNKHGTDAASNLFRNIMKHPNCDYTEGEMALLAGSLQQALKSAMEEDNE